MDENYLAHYGVKGMKWGIRRYQNEDGTLTAEGKRRKRGMDVRNDRKQAVKNRRSLSDQELKSRVDRLRLEKQFKELSDEDLAPGRTAVKKFLTSTGGKVLSSAAVGALAYAGHYALTHEFDVGKAAEYIFPNPNRKRK